MEMYFDKSSEYDVVAVAGKGKGGNNNGRKNDKDSRKKKNNHTEPYNSKFVRKYENRINNK